MSKLRTVALVALVTGTQLAHAAPIDIVQTHKDSGVVLVSDNVKSSLTKRLSSMPTISMYHGNCQVVASKLKRQVACLESNSAGDLVLRTPTGANKAKETVIAQVSNSIKDELATANKIYQEVTKGKPSPFDNRLAYISKNSEGIYSLRVSYYDGSNAKTLHKSSEPILSPSWSPNGRYLTYVSFESVRASIFVHDIQSNRRIKLLTLKGLNAYPSFEDNSNLLVSISGEKMTSEIHRLNILSGELTKLKTSKRADIFPRSLSKNSYLKVGLSPSDVPYGYVVTNGRQKPITSLPLNAISVAENGDLVGLSGKKLVFMKKTATGWGEMVKVAEGNEIESPTISADGSIIYYSVKENGRVFAKASSNDGKNILSLLINNEALIQVSAL